MQRDNSKTEESEESFAFVPKSWMKSISEQLNQINSKLNFGVPQPLQSIGDYLSEPDAKHLLKRKTTWFFNMRKSGKLASTKIGGTNYYDKNDILKLLEDNKTTVPALPFKRKNS